MEKKKKKRNDGQQQKKKKKKKKKMFLFKLSKNKNCQESCLVNDHLAI
jgi:hypothetical protein